MVGFASADALNINTQKPIQQPLEQIGRAKNNDQLSG